MRNGEIRPACEELVYNVSSRNSLLDNAMTKTSREAIEAALAEVRDAHLEQDLVAARRGSMMCKWMGTPSASR